MKAEFCIGDRVAVLSDPRYVPNCEMYKRGKNYRERKCVGETGVIDDEQPNTVCGGPSEPLFRVRFDNQDVGINGYYNVRQAWLDRIVPVDQIEVDEGEFSYET